MTTDTVVDSRPMGGGCLCRGVRYEIRGESRELIACHCEQCRRTSGHFPVYTSVLAEDLAFTEDATLRWFRSSEEAERGFCSNCGGNLFWRRFDSPDISITAGSLDAPTGLRIAQHIFVASQSDYYTLEDGVPKSPKW